MFSHPHGRVSMCIPAPLGKLLITLLFTVARITPPTVPALP